MSKLTFSMGRGENKKTGVLAGEKSDSSKDNQ